MPVCQDGLLPALLALLSAFLFALGIQFTRLGLRHIGSRNATMIQIGSATILYWLCAPVFVESYYWFVPVVVLFALIGVFRPFLSANLSMAGTRYLGPTVSSTLSATSPLFGVALGVLIFGEAFTVPVGLGTAAIVTGVVVLSVRQPATSSWPLWALLLPVGAALIRSLAHAAAKFGMETLPSPFFVGLVGYSVSLVIAVIGYRRRSERSESVLNPGLKWLVATGIIYGFSILSLNTALHCGRMVVVAPIVACSPLFSLLLGRFVFREEAINPRVIAAVLLVVPGIALITLLG